MNMQIEFEKPASRITPKRGASARFEAAQAVDIGARQSQQDAVLADFPAGEDLCIGILADGMGGHLGGEFASRLALSAAYAEIKLQLVFFRTGEVTIPQALSQAVTRANEAVARFAETHPQLAGMGSTLVITVMAGADLYWASVGDSPLFLYRDGGVDRLNQDHSMAPRIEALVATGMIDPAAAADHPQRNQLTSAISGGKISQIDCPTAPTRLQRGDLVVLSSDGLQTLTEEEIARILHKRRRLPCDEINEGLMQAITAADAEDQDNVSVLTVRVLHSEPLHEVRQGAISAGTPPSPGKMRFPDDPSVEEASDLLNQALFL